MNHSVEHAPAPTRGWLANDAHPTVERVRVFENWGYDASVPVKAHVFPGEKPMTFLDLNGSGTKATELTVIDFCTKEGKPVDVITHPQEVQHPQDVPAFHARLQFALGGNYQEFENVFTNPFEPQEDGSLPLYSLVEKTQQGFEDLGYKPTVKVARDGFVEAALIIAEGHLDDEDYVSRVCDWMVTAYSHVTTSLTEDKTHSYKNQLMQTFFGKVNALIQK